MARGPGSPLFPVKRKQLQKEEKPPGQAKENRLPSPLSSRSGSTPPLGIFRIFFREYKEEKLSDFKIEIEGIGDI